MTDIFRKEYKKLDEESISQMNKIKDNAHTLFLSIYANENADPRMLALAKTKLEESVMWAIKAITQ